MPRKAKQGAVAGLIAGMFAGAAGTTALNAITYADMAIRGRPSSSAQSDTVEKLADTAGLSIPGDTEVRGNRKEGFGALSGIGVGVAVGAIYGVGRALAGPPATARAWLLGSLLAGAAAMAAADGSMTRLGVTDPRDWSVSDWLSDVIPHIAYGTVTAGALEWTGRQALIG